MTYTASNGVPVLHILDFHRHLGNLYRSLDPWHSLHVLDHTH